MDTRSNSTCWAALWECLPGWSHVGIDLPGHGSSLPLNAGEQLPTLAHKIGSLAIARGATHLVALSFGAVIALQIALEHPGAFSTLTLGGPILGAGPFDPGIWVQYEEVKKLFRATGHGPSLRDCWMDLERASSGASRTARNSMNSFDVKYFDIPGGSSVDNSVFPTLAHPTIFAAFASHKSADLTSRRRRRLRPSEPVLLIPRAHHPGLRATRAFKLGPFMFARRSASLQTVL